MTAPDPAAFTVRVYTKARTLVGTLDRLRSITATPRHNAQATGQLTLDLDDRLADDLTTEGARVEVDLRGEYLHGGPVTGWAATGPGIAPGLAVYYADDLGDRLRALLAYPSPYGTLAQQTSPQWVSSGPAEAVAKQVIAAAVQRAVAPISIAPNLGRGATVDLVARMHTLEDRLYPLLDAGGIGLSLTPTGPVTQRTGWLLDAYVPRTYPRALSEATGEVADWELTADRPTVTRAIVGGGGEDVDRDFRLVADTAREALYGCRLEVFVDARDARSDLDALDRELVPLIAETDKIQLDLNQLDFVRAQLVRERDTANFNLASHDLYAITLDGIIFFEESQGRNADGWRRQRNDANPERDRLNGVLQAAITRAAEQTALVDARRIERDTAAAARDAKQAEVTAARTAYEAELVRRGQVALAEGDRQGGAVVTFSETAVFTYGRTTGSSVRVGDRVPLDLAPGLQVTEVIREADLTWTPADGFRVAPTVGRNLGDPDRSATDATAALAAVIRNMQARS